MLFKKAEPEKKEPVLLGEDFDIFPDYTPSVKKSKFEDPKAEPTNQEPAIKEEDMTEFQKKVAAIPEDKWKRYQMLAGLGLGILAAIFLFVVPLFAPIGFISFAVAIVLVLLLPRTIERRAGRAMPKLRVWVVAALAIEMVLSVGITYLVNPEYLTTTQTAAETPEPTIMPAE